MCCAAHIRIHVIDLMSTGETDIRWCTAGFLHSPALLPEWMIARWAVPFCCCLWGCFVSLCWLSCPRD
uniref:Uncharacterized protein n=1 Tax=Mola mola TaxID=94237 RepID=A0A3Q3X9L5_MOLML